MRSLLFMLLVCFAQTVFAQQPVSANVLTSPPPPSDKPRLIVGVVVDQMRYDYLYRYEARYGPNGFKRLLKEGFSCENTHYEYVPTYTAPGHAAIYTGATPAVNGIIANEWWDAEWGKRRYVTTDLRYKTVGATGKVGQHSPRVLLSNTITDELRLSNNFRSKVVGICLKDRGSILPAGHIPNACYWFDDQSGGWITSSYYPDSNALPRWVQDFNARKLADAYMAKPWQKLYPGAYNASFEGWSAYKSSAYGPVSGDFPHNLPALLKKTGNYGAIRFTPFGNSLTLDFALEAMDKMELGADEFTDFLCLSFSATDYCGHQFGIHAEEVEDTYLRLDLDIARLLDALDKRFGKDNVLVFLTADHGGGETPAHLKSLHMPADVLKESKLDSALEAALAARTGQAANYIADVANQHIWFHRDALSAAGLTTETAGQAVAERLRAMPGVYDAYTRADWMRLPAEYPFIAQTRRGLHPRRSGDVLFQLEPGWHPDDELFHTGGATHGSPYPYDTHVPLVWYGKRIRPGVSHRPTGITDIAPTIAALLRIMEPNGCTGQPIEEIWKK